MFAVITGFDSEIDLGLGLLLLAAASYVLASWPKWQKQMQEWEQHRREHQQKVEAMLTEIRELLRQKP